MKRFSVGFTLSVIAFTPLTAACAQNTTAPLVAPSAATTAAEVTAQEARPKLTWAPPVLESPITVEVSNSQFSLKLDSAKDYIVKMPSTPVEVGVRISGGRNVVLIGGEIRIPSLEEKPDTDAKKRDKYDFRGMYLHGQTGTIHVEGLWITGAGLREGFNFDQRHGATVQLQNIRVDTVHGTRAGHHADVFQTWAGPAELRIDRLTGYTTYQGTFLMPLQHFKEGDAPKQWDFRNLNIVGTENSGYMLWVNSSKDFPLNVQNVWVSPRSRSKSNRDAFLWPKPSTGDASWNNVQVGLPPEGDFVPEGVAGLNYVSPGYLEASTPVATP
jgi:hypothetical protein